MYGETTQTGHLMQSADAVTCYAVMWYQDWSADLSGYSFMMKGGVQVNLAH